MASDKVSILGKRNNREGQECQANSTTDCTENVADGRQLTVRTHVDKRTCDHIESPRGEMRQRWLRIIQQMLPRAITQARAGAYHDLSVCSDEDSPRTVEETPSSASCRETKQQSTHAGSTRASIANRLGPLPQSTQGGAPIICFGCRETGHTWSDCTRALITCFTCGVFGHRAAFCSQISDPLQGHSSASQTNALSVPRPTQTQQSQQMSTKPSRTQMRRRRRKGGGRGSPSSGGGDKGAPDRTWTWSRTCSDVPDAQG